MPDRGRGQVITFYSYKGGTGRSMALANTACLLARNHADDRGVIMLDWDLEAPGLHRFFRDRFNKAFGGIDDPIYALNDKPGLIDLFCELNSALDTILSLEKGESQFDEDEFVNKLLNEIDLERFTIETDIPNLHLIKAGRSNDQYYSLVRNFPWESLYNRTPWLIRSFAERLADLYQYVLIDSRTGLTDTSGICTKLMPEKLVLVFTPNRQSLNGVLDLGRWVTTYRSESEDLRPLIIFPLPSRIEAAQPDLRYTWRYGSKDDDICGYQPSFENLFKEVYGFEECDLQAYFDKIQIQHVPLYAYGEEIAALDEESQDRLSLTASYNIFTDWLVKLNGPWTATDVTRTRIVDPMGRGDYLTISDAIRGANYGDKIQVNPGLYEESLLMNKPLEIIGNGDRKDITVRATNSNVISFRTTMGRISHLTLKQAAGIELCCIDIQMGRLELEECDISSQGSTCIDIRDGADPRIRWNLIHDSSRNGVVIRNSSQGTLENNEIFDNLLVGVDIRDGSNPVLRHNKIYNGKGSGISIHKDGKGLLEENNIFGNAQGVEISDGGDPVLRSNHIHENRQNGVVIYNKGLGRLEDNDIFSNDNAGVRILSDSNPVIARNKIRNGKGSGVFILENGLGTLDGNRIFGNAHSGVAIADCDCTIRNNKINQNCSYGIHIHTNCRGSIDNNDLRNNKLEPYYKPTKGRVPNISNTNLL